MASYHNSFSYLNKNSAEQGYIITAFEPDNGFVDTFLGMDQIYEDHYDGTKRFLYGARYNNKAIINITLIKANGTDLSINDNRNLLKWLTGTKAASWLDLYQGEKIKYSFLGTVTNAQQYKLDGRVIGISFEFSSITPWAYSEEQVFDRSIEQGLTYVPDGIIVKNPIDEISVSSDGVLCNSAVPGPGACFCIDDNGLLYVENIIVARIDNQTDDLHSYIYLDIEYTNDTCEYLEINNKTLGEVTRIDELHPKDIIYITSKQFITAYTKDQITGELQNQEKVFGDTFNFVWPRLAPGINNFIIDGNGNGTIKFSYRYPIKVGDCAMDISTYGGDAICGCVDDIPSYDTVRWQDITGTPTTIEGYGITNAYNSEEVDAKIEDIDVEWNDVANKPSTVKGYGIADAYTTGEVYNKTEVDNKIENIEVGGGGGSVTIDENKLNQMLNDILT